jgi:hypothetical protein
VGPAHVLCIAGISVTDTIDADLIADVASELDPDNVYWFVAPSDGLDLDQIRKIAPMIHLVEGDLPSAIASSLSSNPGLTSSKQKVLELEDLAVTINTGGKQCVLTFRAAELREFRRHLAILPDLVEQSASLDLSQRKQEFVSFLSRNHQTPDWQGVSEGYAFERDNYKNLLAAVLQRVNVITGSAPRSQSHRQGGQDAPILLAGPPASGRTIGLLWLGYQLRRRGIFVVQLLPSGGLVDNGAVEQIIRVAEGRGAVATAVLLDRADRRVADNLDRHLRSAGRRTLVVAASAPPMGRQSMKEDGESDEDERFRGTVIPLEHQLAGSEIERFREYLAKNYPSKSSDLVLQLLASDPSMFALLYRLIPDTRQNIRDIIVDEYLQLVEGLASFRRAPKEPVRGSSLGEQLQAWLSGQGESVSEPGASPWFATDAWYRIATQLPQLVLLFSSLDEAISLNLLTKRFTGLLQVYATLRETLENSGLFLEVALDKQGDIGLTAVNPFVAQLLLNAAIPSSVARLRLLATLLYEFPWDPERRPSDAPEQALLIHLIRSIASPSGAFQADYQRTEDLRTLAEILKTVREQHGAALPQLMLIEGIVLRHIGRRQADNARGAEAIDLYRQSRTVLEAARDILSQRPVSPARNFEMSMVLNAIATTIGHSFTAESKSKVGDAECKKLIETALITASQSRAYTENYYPLDTAFWTNRDYYRYLNDRPDSEEIRIDRQRALLSMADALDKGGELGELPSDQSDKLAGRLVELDVYLNNYAGAQGRAEAEAKQGRYSGVCLLARLKAIDTKTNQIISAEQAKSALSYLEQFSPRILNDDRALTLMHRLWVGGHLENLQLDEGPYAIGCGSGEWRQLETITQARRTTGGNTRIPYVNFWLAVAVAQQGDMRKALQVLEEVQANSLSFSHRRLRPLIYLSDESGAPTRYAGVVRRRDEDDLITLFVPAFSIEVKVPKRYQGQTMMNLQRADEISVLIALNYWTPGGVDPDWESDRQKSHSVPNSRRKSH